MPFATFAPLSTKSLRRSIAQLINRAGAGVPGVVEHLESLEPRQLLAGNAPSFNEVFNVNNPATPPSITVDGAGAGSISGLISPQLDNDVFTFTATRDDFVRVWADALNSASSLDSRVEVYTARAGTGNSLIPTLIASGSNNGTLTSGTFRDGWAGFTARTGTTYYILVRSDNASGSGSTGNYILRLNDLSTAVPAPNATTGESNVNGTISLRGSDVVYRYDVPSSPNFDGLATITAKPPVASNGSVPPMDTRLDIYRADGLALTLPNGTAINDSDAGYLTNAFVAMRQTPGATYYIRVRSDRIAQAPEPSTGGFRLSIDGRATGVPINTLTRRSEIVSGSTPRAEPESSVLYSFTAQSSGTMVISATPVGLPAARIASTAIRLYDDAGNFIAFNRRPDNTGRINFDVVGGRRYNVVIESFDFSFGGTFAWDVESAITNNSASPGNPANDDHVNTPAGTATPEQIRRTYENATPIVWSAPQLAPAPFEPTAALFPPQPVPTPRWDVVLGRATGRLFGADTDVFQFVPPADMLSAYDGLVQPQSNPPVWANFARPASGLQLIVRQGLLTGAAVRVLDSNFNQVWPQNGTTGRIDDPASFDPTGTGGGATAKLNVWGGYTYYLVVSGGEGRYDIQIQADAATNNVSNPTGVRVGQVNVSDGVPSAGAFADARVLSLSVGASEVTNNFNVGGSFAQWLNPPAAGLSAGNPPQWSMGPSLPVTGFAPTLGRGRAINYPADGQTAGGTGATFNPGTFIGSPGTNGALIMERSDYGILPTPSSTDLFQIRALYSGTAEVRINTTGIDDSYAELISTYQLDPADPQPPDATITTQQSGPLNSPLDSALRIFDNDGQEIAFNNDNGVIAGDEQSQPLGTLGNRAYKRRDARVVFPVEAGQVYFIQIESGQRAAFLAGGIVDWRVATGSYELLVAATPNLNFNDDHVGGNAAAKATTIPISLDTTSPSAVLGSVSGVIDNTVSVPNDTDTFTFLSPAGRDTAGATAVVRLVPTNGAAFNKQLSIFSGAGALIGAPVTATGSNTATISFAAAKGERFFVLVDGVDPADEGSYRVEVLGVPLAQNSFSSVVTTPRNTTLPATLSVPTATAPRVNDFANAAIINRELYDATGNVSVNGSLAAPGDTAIYRFDGLDFSRVRVDLTSRSGANLRPAFTVYEVGADFFTGVESPPGAPMWPNTPVLLPVGQGDAQSSTSNTATASVPLTRPDRLAPNLAGQTPRTFNSYYIVVRGVDPGSDAGDYTLSLRFLDPDPASSNPSTTDDYPDQNQWPIAAGISVVNNPASQTGTGGADGRIELSGDTDLFTFTSQGTGTVSITLSSPSTSRLRPQLRVFDSNFNLVSDESSGNTIFNGPDAQISAVTITFQGTRNSVYYILVSAGPTGGFSIKNQDVGTYSVSINTQFPDDHANAGEFDLATNVVLSTFTGQGSEPGVLSPAGDTDLFRFTTLADGNVTINVTADGQLFRPTLRLFGPDRQPITDTIVDGGAGDQDGVVNGVVVRTITGTTLSQTYWILVTADGSGNPTGPYVVAVNGPRPGGGGGETDDHANAGDFANATPIAINPQDGRGNSAGRIFPPDDTDLFFFISPSVLPNSPEGARRATVQIVTPEGQALRVGVRVFGPNQQLIASNTAGIAGGALASFTIDAPAARYYIEVDGLSLTEVGNYVVRVATEPPRYFLYYPEGFANRTIREYVAIGNTNDFPVEYTVRLRYERNFPETVLVSNAVIQPNTRGGVTISDGPNGVFPGVRVNQPYSIIIESNAFLAANISHYDFGSTFGEAFTRTTSTSWSFARSDKFPGGINDFAIVYNPNPTPSLVTLTAYYNTGQVVTLATTIQGNRRGGWNFNDTPALPSGQFSFVISSQPAVSTDNHVGVVASLTHYNLLTSPRNGYGMLGEPSVAQVNQTTTTAAGTLRGVIPGLVQGDAASAQVTLFNASDTDAAVELRGTYINAAIPSFLRNVNVPARSFVNLTGESLGLVLNQPLGVRYDSNVPLTVLAGTTQLGSIDVTHGNTELGTSWYWGDAFIASRAAGTLYFETMFFYNPDTVNPLTVTLDFVYSRSLPGFGSTSSTTVTVPAGGFAQIDLHRTPELLTPRNINIFSIEASADRPFSAKMNHYDLSINGGWGSRGAPFGLTTGLPALA